MFFQVGYLANLRGVLPLQTAQALEPFQEKAKRYPDWNPDERREFLQPLPRVLDSLIRCDAIVQPTVFAACCFAVCC